MTGGLAARAGVPYQSAGKPRRDQPKIASRRDACRPEHLNTTGTLADLCGTRGRTAPHASARCTQERCPLGDRLDDGRCGGTLTPDLGRDLRGQFGRRATDRGALRCRPKGLFDELAILRGQRVIPRRHRTTDGRRGQRFDRWSRIHNHLRRDIERSLRHLRLCRRLVDRGEGRGIDIPGLRDPRQNLCVRCAGRRRDNDHERTGRDEKYNETKDKAHGHPGSRRRGGRRRLNSGSPDHAQRERSETKAERVTRAWPEAEFTLGFISLGRRSRQGPSPRGCDRHDEKGRDRKSLVASSYPTHSNADASYQLQFRSTVRDTTRPEPSRTTDTTEPAYVRVPTCRFSASYRPARHT